MANLCIIPARAGSKRIPLKNIKYFLGKPIITYSIEVALNSQLFDEVMVSTDSDEIAEIAIKLGAKVPFKRSVKNANDFATTSDVLEEVIEMYNQNGRKFNNACCIYPTAPFLTIERLSEGYNKLIKENKSSVFPVVPFGYPIWRGLSINEVGNVEMIWPENLNARSQDLKSAYHDAGQWYWFNIEAFKKEGKIFMESSGALVLSDLEVQDIDNNTDWQTAELKYQLIQRLNKKEEDLNRFFNWILSR